MTKTLAESLLFTSVAINAALLIFFAGVFRKMMNSIDEAEFKKLTELLVRYSSKSPFMIIVLNLPLLGVIPYYYFYGFGNWWITAGIALWLVAGSISKIYKLPVYRAISTLKSGDAIKLKRQRYKLDTGNLFQAILYSAAVIIMAFGLR
ncbi:MAG TPA: hypothetical protein VGZ90_07735 [Puia sp.]|jgi:hypothetical protein|nr:hypothetical protein [Puia sp.]